MKMEDLRVSRKEFIKEFENIGEIWRNRDESGRFEGFLESDL